MKKLLLALLAVLVMVGCTPSATPSGRRITVEMRDFYFSPIQVDVQSGEQITWVLQNKGQYDHQFESKEGGLAEVVVPVGMTKEVAWRAPTKPGNYTFVCGVHERQGMRMTVVVK